MAKLEANGDEVFRFENLRGDDSLRSNGIILRCTGHKWHFHARVRTGSDIYTLAEKVKDGVFMYEAVHPAYKLFKDELIYVAGMDRNNLLTYIKMHPNSPDVIYDLTHSGSSKVGIGIAATRMEIANLCMMYGDMIDELAKKKTPLLPDKLP